MMRRPRNFKPFLWLRRLFISSLAHENRGSFRPDYEQYRTRRDVFDSRVVVEIHEPRKVSKDEHAARGVVLRSGSPVIVIGFLYDLACAFRNLFRDAVVPPDRKTTRLRSALLSDFHQHAGSVVLWRRPPLSRGHAKIPKTNRSDGLSAHLGRRDRP